MKYCLKSDEVVQGTVIEPTGMVSIELTQAAPSQRKAGFSITNI